VGRAPSEHGFKNRTTEVKDARITSTLVDITMIGNWFLVSYQAHLRSGAVKVKLKKEHS
jgi:hypothetical protein